jgi:hypothetical protein
MNPGNGGQALGQGVIFSQCHELGGVVYTKLPSI